MQPMDSGVEVALGVVREPTMGPLVMVGAGGVATDLWDDRVFLLPPFALADAERAVRGLRIWPLLEGFRGARPADGAALERLVVDLGRLAVDVPEVAELDLNPVMVGAYTCFIVDVRLRLARPTTPAPGRRGGSPARLTSTIPAPGPARHGRRALPYRPRRSRLKKPRPFTRKQKRHDQPLSQAPVVLAADGTPSSEGALRFAVQESGVRGTGLVIVHVNPMDAPAPPLRPIPAVGPVPAVSPAVPSGSRCTRVGCWSALPGRLKSSLPA